MTTLFLAGYPAPLLGALKKARATVGNAVFFSACIAVLYLAPTLYMMQVYDRVVPTSGVLTLVWLTLLVGLAVGTLTILDSLRQRMLARLGVQLEQELSGPILSHVLVADQGVEGARTTQSLRDFDNLKQVLAGPTAVALLDLPWSPVFLLVAFVIHPVLGLMILGAGCVLIMLAVVNERAAREGNRRAHAAMGQSQAIQSDLASRTEVIRALGMHRAAIALQQQARAVGITETLRVQIAGGHYAGWVKFVRMFMQSVALGVAAWLAIGGQISIGTIIAASVLLSRALQPIEQIVGGWAQVQQARQGLASLKTILADSRPDDIRAMALPVPTGRIEVVNASLRNAAGNAFLLRGINLSLAPGEITCVMGASGAGKSTLARILCGAIMPEVGEVRIDGATYKDWDRERLAAHVGYMPQDSSLLPGTIAENISRFAALRGELAELVETKVIVAARQAGIHDMILRLPDGYATRLGTPAFALSGGQAQRVSLARAVYGDPHLLVLDEPNGALDTEGERALVALILRAREAGRIVVVVAHNSALLGHADRLVIMNSGSIERAGTRQEILDELNRAVRSNVVAMPGAMA